MEEVKGENACKRYSMELSFCVLICELWMNGICFMHYFLCFRINWWLRLIESTGSHRQSSAAAQPKPVVTHLQWNPEERYRAHAYEQ